MDSALKELAFALLGSWVSIVPSSAAAVVMVVAMTIQRRVSATLGGGELIALSGSCAQICYAQAMDHA
jgi:hypothetical protein